MLKFFPKVHYIVVAYCKIPPKYGQKRAKGLKPTKNGKFWTELLENVSRETFVLQKKIRLFHVKHNLNENQINLFHVEHKKIPSGLCPTGLSIIQNISY